MLIFNSILKGAFLAIVSMTIAFLIWVLLKLIVTTFINTMVFLGDRYGEKVMLFIFLLTSLTAIFSFSFYFDMAK